MVSEKKSVRKRIFGIIMAVLLVFVTVSMLVTKLVYDRVFSRYDCEEHTPPAALSEMVASRETKTYSVGDHTLTGYLYRGNAAPEQTALVVIAPGFHACADSYLWQIQSLLDYGYAVFAFDTTGSCHSQGRSSVGFPQELRDLERTLQYLETNDRFGCRDVVLMGHSRGGYAACCALVYGYDIAAVVSVSGVNSAMEGVIGAAEPYVGALAYGNYGFLWLYQSLLFGADTVNQRACDAISQSDVPVLLIHSTSDTTVPSDKYSIVAHRDEIHSAQVEYHIGALSEADGHTALLFDADGTANDALMRTIHEFLAKQLQ